MKKLIAISVLFALISGAAFAELNFGGSFSTQVIPALGRIETTSASTTTSDLLTKQLAVNGHLDLNYKNGDGTVNGRVRLVNGSTSSWDAYYFVQWQALPALWIQAGRNGDGVFGAAKISGWGFHGSAQDFVAVDGGGNLRFGKVATADNELKITTVTGNPRYASDSAFYGGFNSLGVALTIKPADTFKINIALPFGGEQAAINTYGKFHLNLNIGLPNVGEINASFKANSFDGTGSAGDAYVSFYLTAVDSFKLDIGAGAAIPASGDPFAVKIGVGFSLANIDTFGLKARVGADIANDTTIGINVLPSFNLDAFKLFINLGFGMTLLNGGGDLPISFYVNPYLSKGLDVITLYAGIVFAGGATNNTSTITWGIPLGISASF